MFEEFQGSGIVLHVSFGDQDAVGGVAGGSRVIFYAVCGSHLPAKGGLYPVGADYDVA